MILPFLAQAGLGVLCDLAELTGAAFGALFYNVLNEAGESMMLYTLSGAERSDFAQFGMPRATAVFHPTFAGESVDSRLKACP